MKVFQYHGSRAHDKNIDISHNITHVLPGEHFIDIDILYIAKKAISC